MYEAYWELTEPPFDNSPNPKFFYLSPDHEEALVRLVYTVRHRKGCGMLTGEYGCGKTTLSRALIQRLETERYEIGLPRAGRRSTSSARSSTSSAWRRRRRTSPSSSTC